MKEYFKLKSFRIVMVGLLEPVTRAAALALMVFGFDREGVELVLRGRILAGNRGLRIGRSVRFIGSASKFIFGKNVTFYGNTYLNVNAEKGKIVIGAGTHIDQLCVLYAQGGIEIGKNTAIASGVLIYSQSNADSLKDGTAVSLQPVIYSPVKISDGCWLGAGCRILPGIILEENVIVGSGAVVTKSVCREKTVVGVPAKVIKNK